MPLIIQVATETDAPRSAAIESAAYAPNPFNKILFPGPMPAPESGRTPRAEELAKTLREDSTVRWLKVVDTDIEPTEDNKQMIGFAQWNIKDGSEPRSKPRTFGPGCNLEACEALFGGLYELRAKHFEGTKHAHLRLLHVDPEHQRRGAGRMLVMWGVEEARRLGLPAYLESSLDGHSLYLSCGFRDIDMQSIDCTKWGKDTAMVNYVMALELLQP
ncbi:acyl-CoA N-acyltransferase [Astrocystis sublimbata]|nr:acyl-CoA N-acyltransferase [Astrocystis sublimbata]